MTREERSYNYASKKSPSKFTVSEIAKHYDDGFIDGYKEAINKVYDFIDKETYEQPILTPSAEIYCVNLGMKHCNNKKEFIKKLKENNKI